MNRRTLLKSSLAMAGAACPRTAGLLFEDWGMPAVLAQGQNQKKFEPEEFMIGATFRGDAVTSEAEIDHLLRLFAEHNFKVIWLIVDVQFNPDQKAWDFAQYDAIYDIAAKYGIGVIPYFLSFFHRSYIEGPSDLPAMYDAHFNERTDEYLRQAVTHFRDHPAQFGWVLQSEPRMVPNFHPVTLGKFCEWLRERYGTVQRLNALWRTQYTDFSAIEVRENTWTITWPHYPSFRDWTAFSMDQLTVWMDHIGRQVRRYDTAHPTNINPAGVLGNTTASSQDYWGLARTVDHIGTSLHPGHQFSRFGSGKLPIVIHLHLDMMRSVGKQHPHFWLTEFQSGPNLLSAAVPFTPRAHHMTQWIWNAWAAGCSYINFWSWNSRSDGYEAGEWSLLNMAGEPSERAIAAKTAIDTMRKHRDLLTGATPIPARAAILYSKDNCILALKEYRQNPHTPMDALFACYQALWEANIAVDVINTDELLAGDARRYRAIYMTDMLHLDAACAEALSRFVADGGSLWADSLCAWKDSNGYPATPFPAGLEQVFGGVVEDVIGQDQPFTIRLAGGGTIPAQTYEIWLRPKTAQAIGWFANGRPAVLENSYGRGKARLVGTALCRRLFTEYEATAGTWIAEFARSAVGENALLRLEEAQGRVRLRSMGSPRALIAVISNHGEAGAATLSLGRPATLVRDITTDESWPLSAGAAGATIRFSIPANATRVLVVT
jgi:beta-galactosidase GanA